MGYYSDISEVKIIPANGRVILDTGVDRSHVVCVIPNENFNELRQELKRLIKISNTKLSLFHGFLYYHLEGINNSEVKFTVRCAWKKEKSSIKLFFVNNKYQKQREEEGWHYYPYTKSIEDTIENVEEVFNKVKLIQ